MTSLKPYKCAVRKIHIELQNFLHDESGVVESTLVIVPLVILFLSILQIASAVIQHNALANQVQGDISRTALYGANSPFDGATKRPLPGGGAVIIGRRTESVIPLSPLLLGQPSISAVGISVDENQ